jgi:hypothetical protein
MAAEKCCQFRAADEDPQPRVVGFARQSDRCLGGTAGRARGRSRFTSPSFLFLCQLLSGAALVGVWLAVTVVISLIAAIGYVAVTGPGTPKVTRHHPAKEPTP